VEGNRKKGKQKMRVGMWGKMREERKGTLHILSSAPEFLVTPLGDKKLYYFVNPFWFSCPPFV